MAMQTISTNVIWGDYGIEYIQIAKSAEQNIRLLREKFIRNLELEFNQNRALYKKPIDLGRSILNNHELKTFYTNLTQLLECPLLERIHSITKKGVTKMKKVFQTYGALKQHLKDLVQYDNNPTEDEAEILLSRLFARESEFGCSQDSPCSKANCSTCGILFTILIFKEQALGSKRRSIYREYMVFISFLVFSYILEGYLLAGIFRIPVEFPKRNV